MKKVSKKQCFLRAAVKKGEDGVKTDDGVDKKEMVVKASTSNEENGETVIPSNHQKDFLKPNLAHAARDEHNKIDDLSNDEVLSRPTSQHPSDVPDVSPRSHTDKNNKKNVKKKAKKSKKQRKVTKMVVAVVVTFATCWLPIQIIFLTGSFSTYTEGIICKFLLPFDVYFQISNYLFETEFSSNKISGL